jgi:Glycosyl hydrolase family 99
MALTRRRFLAGSVGAGLGVVTTALVPGPLVAEPGGAVAAPLAHLFPDLRRRLVFEYYPWYGRDPFRHWDQWDRVPPVDLASHYVPDLGAYDSRSPTVMERHARWIAESGAGAINVSWWGRETYEDRLVPRLMDVMKDHDIRVAFHLEPYTPDHGRRFADDVLYLLREYGEKRSYDALLLVDGPSHGAPSPVFKGFRTIVPAEKVDCHGVPRAEWDYTPDAEWRRQLDRLRDALGADFPGALFLADSVDSIRARNGGFDGIAVYDNYVGPDTYRAHAVAASEQGLLFSFNVNAGFDGIARRRSPPGGCDERLPFAPPADTPIDWTRAPDLERAAALSESRVLDSFRATLEAQADPALSNAQQGFFLAYLNSFNEWHEGTAFEPMADAAALTDAERSHGYHNPSWGGYRLATLRRAIASVSDRAPAAPPARGA